MKPVKIYVLRSPTSSEVRYVGLTTLTLNKRRSLHISHAKNGETALPVSCWIRSLLRRDLRPIIDLIEDRIPADRESFWIEHYRAQGCCLLNLSIGGERSSLGVVRSDETRRRMSIAQLGNKGRLGQPLSSDHKAIVSRKGDYAGLYRQRQNAVAYSSSWYDRQGRVNQRCLGLFGHGSSRRLHGLRRPLQCGQ